MALVKVYKADRQGNAIFKYTAANFNTVMATAADLVILEVEKLVEVGEIEPDQVHFQEFLLTILWWQRRRYSNGR